MMCKTLKKKESVRRFSFQLLIPLNYGVYLDLSGVSFFNSHCLFIFSQVVPPRTRLCGTLDNGGTQAFMFFFCVKGKVGGDNTRLLRDESIEACSTEQRCSVDLRYVTFCFVLLLVRPLGF